MFQVNNGGNHTHNRGLLAGLGAGAAGVIALLVLLLMDWHSISGPIADAVKVIVGAVALVVAAAALFAVWYLFLRARHHARHPETLFRQPVRAEAIPADAPPAITGTPVAIPAYQPAAALPPGRDVILPADPDEAIAMIQALKAEGIVSGRRPR